MRAELPLFNCVVEESVGDDERRGEGQGNERELEILCYINCSIWLWFNSHVL